MTEKEGNQVDAPPYAWVTKEPLPKVQRFPHPTTRPQLLEASYALIESVADMNEWSNTGLPNSTNVEAETFGNTDRDCASSWPDGL
ncbi:hypothetical protein CaCOL14_003772 [Colletotrichum acutatum]